MQVQKRNFGLDLLRAAAITMVFFSHGVTFGRIPILGEMGTGVDMFFVLSGFLIGRIYFRSQKEQTFKPGSFWKARWWRTLPPYFAALALFAIASVWFPGNPIRWYYVLFLQNYAGVKGFGPSWSLCVEEHFYLLLPIFGFLVARTLGRKSFLWLLPVAFWIPFLLRLGTLAATGTLPPDWYWMTHFHCEGLIAGLWIAYLFVERPDLFLALRKPAQWGLLIIPITLGILPMWTTRGLWVNIWVFTVLALGYAAWLRALYDFKWEPASASSRLVYKTITGAALCSYSVYLVHVLFFDIVRLQVDPWPRGLLKTGFILTTTALAGILFYFLFERTSIITRDRYMKRDRPKTETLDHIVVPG